MKHLSCLLLLVVFLVGCVPEELPRNYHEDASILAITSFNRIWMHYAITNNTEEFCYTFYPDDVVLEKCRGDSWRTMERVPNDTVVFPPDYVYRPHIESADPGETHEQLLHILPNYDRLTSGDYRLVVPFQKRIYRERTSRVELEIVEEFCLFAPFTIP